MPAISLSVPAPGPDDLAAMSTAVLEARTYAHGICFRPENAPTRDSDRWYPVTVIPARLEELAREACKGCPAIAECLEWAIRTEVEVAPGELDGLRGGLAPHERAALIRQRRPQEVRS